MAIRQRKVPNRDGKRPWLVELPDPKRPGRTLRIGTYSTEPEAKDAEFEAEKSRRGGHLPTNRNNMTVADVCREFVAYHKARLDAKVIKETTHGYYRHHLIFNVVPTFLGPVKLRKLKKSDILEWYLELAKKIPTGTTPKKTKSALKAALEYAADEERGWISPGDVLVMFRKLPVLKRKPHRPQADLGDLDLFFRTIRRIRPHHELPFLIAVTTGARLGEVSGLTWECCHFETRHFTVHCPKTDTVRGGVEMTSRVFSLLSALWNRQGQPSDGFVFPGECGAKTIYALLQKVFAEVMKAEAGTFKVWDEASGKYQRKFTIHSFRRYYISQLKERLGLDAASESVGHSTLEQTKDYCRPVIASNPKRRIVVEQLGATFAPALALPSPQLALPAPDTTNDTTIT